MKIIRFPVRSGYSALHYTHNFTVPLNLPSNPGHFNLFSGNVAASSVYRCQLPEKSDPWQKTPTAERRWD
jgi:hypothetical protein